jgi:hypothetical protein
LRRQYFKDGVVVIDCGANIGAHTIEWGKRMTGWGSVLAIEAQERIYYALPEISSSTTASMQSRFMPRSRKRSAL